MTYGNPAVNLVCFLMICAAFALSPLYAIWIGGGAIADRRERAKVMR